MYAGFLFGHSAPLPPPQCLCINNFSSILKASLLLNSITFSHADQ